MTTTTFITIWALFWITDMAVYAVALRLGLRPNWWYRITPGGGYVAVFRTSLSASGGIEK